MSSSKEKRLEWFRNARYGMFIHWGLYSVLGRGEWVMCHEQIPQDEYAKLAKRFNPQNFDPEEWVLLAKKAGMKYMVLTTRHHDGFCLFDSKVSDFTSTKTAAGRDFVAEFVKACRKHDMKVGLYYSLSDWRFGIRGINESWEGMEKSRAQAHAQVRELMSNYGKIDILWYDGSIYFPSLVKDGGPDNVADFFHSKKLNRMVRKLQPEILINNRSGLKEDFGTPEQFARPDAEQAWECCMTVGCERGWGYLRYDADLKTPASLLAVLVNCASHGGNFLLNIGPKSNGSVPAKIKNRLFKIGEWLDKYGDSIYETEAGPGGGAAGFCTQKGKTIYLHTLWWPGTKVALPRIKEPVKSAKILSTGQKLTVAKTKDGRLQLSGLPSAPPDYTNTVIQITCQ